MSKKTRVTQVQREASSGRWTVRNQSGDNAMSTTRRDPSSGEFIRATELSQRILKDSAETHREALERLAKR